MKKILFTIFSILIVLSCVKKRNLTNNSVVVDLESFPDGLHPTNSSSGPASFVQAYYSFSLIGINTKTEKYKPLLIKELPKADSTGLIYYYELNGKAKWDNGKPLSVNDIIFSWKLMLSPLTDNAFIRGVYSGIIEDVYAHPNNSNGVYVKVKKVHYNNMSNVSAAATIMQESFWDPKGILTRYSIKDLTSEKFKSNTELDNWFNDFNDSKNAYDVDRLVGMGPYKVTELSNKLYIKLEKKKDWWGDKFLDEGEDFQAYPNQLIFKVTPDPSAGYLAMKCQEIDVLKNRGSNWISKFRRLRSLDYFNDNYKSDFVSTPLFRYLGMNMKPDGVDYKPFFVDLRVRKAMAYLAPLDDMIEYLLYGHAKRQPGIVSADNPNADTTLKLVPYDLEKAKKLLDEAGWVDSDADNIRDKVINGERIQFKFKLNFYADPSLTEIALVLKESMAKAGIVLVPNPLDFGTLFGNAYDHKFDAILAAWGGGVTYSDPNQIWSTKSWATKSANFVGFGDAESDSLIEAANTKLDEVEHLKAYRALQRKICKEQPYIFFWSEPYVMACHKRFGNIRFYRSGNKVNINGLQLKNK